VKLEKPTVDALLAKYGIHVAKGDRVVPPGTEIAIDGFINPDGRRVIRARSSAHAAERIVPLGDAAARALVDGLRSRGHHVPDGAARRMLEHLFMRVSAMFSDAELAAFLLDPVRLHESGYVVIAATVSAPAAINVPPRLDRHARDHKTFRATGQQ